MDERFKLWIVRNNKKILLNIINENKLPVVKLKRYERFYYNKKYISIYYDSYKNMKYLVKDKNANYFKDWYMYKCYAVQKNTNKKLYDIRVEPELTLSEKYRLIKDLINFFNKNILISFDKDRSTHIHYNYSNFSEITDKIIALNRTFKKFIHDIDYLFNHLDMTIIKRYIRCNEQKSIDAVSIRKNIMMPGKRKYVPYSYMSYDIKNNEFIYYLLNRIISIASQEETYFERIKVYLKNIYKIGGTSSKSSKRIKKQGNKHLKSCDEHIKALRRYIRIIVNDRRTLEIKGVNTESSLTNNSLPFKYNNVYIDYLKLMHINMTINIHKKSMSYFEKKWHYLYEVWTYITLVKILLSLGYTIISKNISPSHVLYYVRHESYFSLGKKLKDGHTIELHVVYNGVINKENRKNNNNSCEIPLIIPSINNYRRHDNPDIRIDVFLHSGNTKSYIKTIILDAKYMYGDFLSKEINEFDPSKNKDSHHSKNGLQLYTYKNDARLARAPQLEDNPVVTVFALFPKETYSIKKCNYVIYQELNPCNYHEFKHNIQRSILYSLIKYSDLPLRSLFK